MRAAIRTENPLGRFRGVRGEFVRIRVITLTVPAMRGNRRLLREVNSGQRSKNVNGRPSHDETPFCQHTSSLASCVRSQSHQTLHLNSRASSQRQDEHFRLCFHLSLARHNYNPLS